MATWAVKHEAELGRGFVLSPERYDPRRQMPHLALGESQGTPLREIAVTVRKTVNASTPGLNTCLVLDTSDAGEGVIVSPKRAVEGKQLGSAKKVLEPSDVIISRLRPYLRQVAYVDAAIRGWKRDGSLVCSTEFFVLRPIDGRSIAFLVPFLLSQPVQDVLAASQEGGHHPRFDEATLLSLAIPDELLSARDELSRSVESSIALYRESERVLSSMVEEASRSFGGCLPSIPTRAS